MYDVRPNLIIGFHGCDESTSLSLIKNPNNIYISEKPFDWLGHGMYFWENNYERALAWAKEKKKRGTIKKPAVLGAIINLGYCCDFLDAKYIQLLLPYYKLMVDFYHRSGKPIPINKDVQTDQFKDKILRERDCSVIEFMHSELNSQIQSDLTLNGTSTFKFFDSVRGTFTEGGPIFEGAGIFEKSHIQVCIRNLNCIKGFFLPRKEIDFASWNQRKYNSVTNS